MAIDRRCPRPPSDRIRRLGLRSPPRGLLL